MCRGTRSGSRRGPSAGHSLVGSWTAAEVATGAEGRELCVGGVPCSALASCFGTERPHPRSAVHEILLRGRLRVLLPHLQEGPRGRPLPLGHPPRAHRVAGYDRYEERRLLCGAPARERLPIGGSSVVYSGLLLLHDQEVRACPALFPQGLGSGPQLRTRVDRLRTCLRPPRRERSGPRGLPHRESALPRLPLAVALHRDGVRSDQLAAVGAAVPRLLSHNNAHRPPHLQ
mmetsp:Transcript_52712/g.112760  ORF Transcript_52712/g.112760 Transcript_52712/m.112760 type:complete len:230 (-) Transcript_52712:415-1104(-)